ncbi:MAG: hypothetical protein OXU37_03295 [Thaumarchaeota archaeon]|nr:hypothetical protein [Nitrososphaerota archaeon]RNJ71422.1 MAG: hypothetical protein EB833_07170 [Thaumarchaeota archaeon S13]RNJ72079.1 MAG: hypothetical protein EB832_04600 [Thaumarchaeota archaeon S14]RNJ73855.1 MAG: hypothetical protein EB824_04365 [Thaumarchaeota archaeon S15]MDD9809164.1 hypothetical protein [Nitrososphaerota archaeon]
MRTSISCRPRTIVLRRRMDDAEARAAVESRKAAAFRTLLSSPRASEIHTHSVRVAYEAVTMASGRYSATYYRKATHTIRVDHNVIRVEAGDGTFEARPQSRIGRAVSGRGASRRVDLEVEELVSDEREGSVFVDHHGRQTAFSHGTRARDVEPYPRRVLASAEEVRDPEIGRDALVALLRGAISDGPDPSGVRDLEDSLEVTGIERIYVPIVEARLAGPKRRTKILRIDAVSRRRLKA